MELSLSEFEPNVSEDLSVGVASSLQESISQPGFAAIEPAAPTFHRLLFGDDGLRAGWSVLLYFVLVALVAACLKFVLDRYHLMPKGTRGAKELAPQVMAIREMLQFAMFAIPAWLMSLIERRPFGRYGLTCQRMLTDFGAGLFWGFTALSVLIGMLLAAHAITFDGFLIHGTEALQYAGRWALVFLFVGLFEEFFFRGYLQYTVARGAAGIARTMDPENRYSHVIGFWVAAAIFSLSLFMVAHLGNGGETASGIVAVGLAGVVFAFSLYRTGSLWWGIGMHTAWDWAQSYFYGTPDSGMVSAGRLMSSHAVGSKFLSGGTDGPEGSILVIPTLLLVALVIHLTLPRRNYFLTPDQAPIVEGEREAHSGEAAPVL